MPLSRLSMLLLVAVCVASTSIVFAQQDCSGGRYFDPIFSDADVALNVLYGENVQPVIGNPNATQQLFLDVYQPQGDTLTQRPLVILAFGGAFVSGSKFSPDIVELCQRLAKRGYVAVSIDYRLTPELAVQANENTATLAVLKATHDMRAAVRFMRADAANGNNYRINTNQIWVGGVSAGGFTALHTAYLDKLSEIPSSIVADTAGLGGIEGNSGSSGYSSEVAGVINLCGALGDLNTIEAGDVPIVSVHGTADDVVPYDDAVLDLFGINMQVYGSSVIHERTDSLGISNSLRLFPGAGHTPFVLGSNTANYMDTTFQVVRDFLYQEICTATQIDYPAPVFYNAVAFPNPSSGHTFIELKNIQIETVVCTDVAGNSIALDWQLRDQSIQLFTQSLAAGQYLILLRGPAGNLVATSKLIVE